MTQTRVRYVYILITLGALFGVLLLCFWHPKKPVLEGIVRAGTHEIPVTIADTPEAREQGLSDTPSLTPKTGKIFIFDKPDAYGFWMKDMRYPLDIVWIGADFRIVGITANLSPDTYPQAFYPEAPVQYVLEVNAGDANQLELFTGTTITFKRNF